eukprot:361318-Chlamydomonas_euryale.AAC.2
MSTDNIMLCGDFVEESRVRCFRADCIKVLRAASVLEGVQRCRLYVGAWTVEASYGCDEEGRARAIKRFKTCGFLFALSHGAAFHTQSRTKTLNPKTHKLAKPATVPTWSSVRRCAHRRWLPGGRFCVGAGGSGVTQACLAVLQSTETRTRHRGLALRKRK